MRGKQFLFMSFILLAAGLAAAAVNITGSWEMTMTTPRGERKTDVSFVQDGEKLTVKTIGREGEEITGAGTVKGNDVEWTITRNTPRGEMTSVYKGKLDGDKMSGTVQMGPNGEFKIEWTAVRKK